MKRLIVFALLFTAVSLAKTKPEEFTLTATVTEIKSHDEVTGSHGPAPMNTGNASFDKAYNAAAGHRSYADTETMFVMVTEIGDRIYELESPRRWELGTYKAKQYERGFEFLATDKHGKPTGRWLKIVGEKMKPKPAETH